ncbi:hypothetical protein H6784_04850 [Candidatus Nomurabacteria bacterium]|nr:hypothetical protein [Candidatus Kaiserbacteria bacterium]MCB9814718.1 hypothetical protein [Candidatus Nomurabacteria bacterium]
MNFVPSTLKSNLITPEQRVRFAQKIANHIFAPDEVKSCPVIWDETTKRFELHRDSHDYWLYPPDGSSDYWRMSARYLDSREIQLVLDPFAEVFMHV